MLCSCHACGVSARQIMTLYYACSAHSFKRNAIMLCWCRNLTVMCYVCAFYILVLTMLAPCYVAAFLHCTSVVISCWITASWTGRAMRHVQVQTACAHAWHTAIMLWHSLKSLWCTMLALYNSSKVLHFQYANVETKLHYAILMHLTSSFQLCLCCDMLCRAFTVLA